MSDDARTALIGAANQLRDVLSTVNRHGDDINRDLAMQADGFAYGEIYDGLKILLGALFPDEPAEDIHTVMCEGDLGAEEAARHVRWDHSPLARYSTDEIRDNLIRYRSYLVTLDEGLLDTVGLIGDHGTETDDKARQWLQEEIHTCVSALAFRDADEARYGTALH